MVMTNTHSGIATSFAEMSGGGLVRVGKYKFTATTPAGWLAEKSSLKR